ncbi:MAG: hypothetical protein U0V75_10560 [Ferruginibacter sp.]
MKTRKFYTAFIPAAFAILFSSCKKTDAFADNTAAQETTYELSAGQALADNISEDANTVFMEAAAVKNLLGSNTQAITTGNVLNGAVVTVSSGSGFPKSIVINFSDGITTNGVVRTGKINVVLSDSVRKTGSNAVITFTNYSTNGFKKEGTITWTNTSTATTKGWQRKIENGKVTAPDGRFWLHSGTRDAVQIAGANTPNTLLDDNYLITGNQTVTNSAGKTSNCYITEALQKKTVCDNIGTGKLKVQGDNHTALIDFGNGDCDKLATVSVDGGDPRTINLR